MNNKLVLAALLAAIPSSAFADPGGGTDMFKVNREIEAMTRDGRWDRLLAEGVANKKAFDDLKAREATGATQPANGYARQPRR